MPELSPLRLGSPESRPALVLVDVQERLLTAFPEPTQRALLPRIGLLLTAARTLPLPAVVAEQYPQGLGQTLATLRELTEPTWPVVTKTSFSCFGEPTFAATLPVGCNTLILCGVEAHVCVQQTALDALAAGIPLVVVAADAVASRHAADHAQALALMASEGIRISTAEAIVFMLMRHSRHPAFKVLSAYLRQLDADQAAAVAETCISANGR